MRAALTPRVVGGRYELLGPLGPGGDPSCHRARDAGTSREVALKILRAPSAAALRRLERELGALRAVASPAVARVLDVGHEADDEGADVFLVTELVDGEPFAPETLGGLPVDALAALGCALLEGLVAIHEAGAVHGDVKPENVRVVRDAAGARPVLVDLGRVPDDLEATSPGGARARRAAALAWIAPETFLGGSRSPASDLYQAGLVLLEAVGEGPLVDGAPEARARARVGLDVEAAIAARLGPARRGLGAVLARLLAPRPEARFEDARAARRALATLLGPAETPEPGPVTDVPPPRGSAPTSREPGAALPPSASRPVARAPRLARLDPDPLVALRDALAALDLPMVDALGRRERGGAVGRLARLAALALRVEVDAAALVLEPLLPDPLARLVGATLVAPLARRATRARLRDEGPRDVARGGSAELVCCLVLLECALAPRDRLPAAAARLVAARARLDAEGHAPASPTLEETLEVVDEALGVALDPEAIGPRVAEALASLAGPRDAATPLEALVRALVLGVAATPHDEALGRLRLDEAARVVEDRGLPLFFARVAVARGKVEATSSERAELVADDVERACTLVAHGDVPLLQASLERERGRGLVARGRPADALRALLRGRELLRVELEPTQELELAALAALVDAASGGGRAGARGAAREGIAELTDERLGALGGRAAALCFAVRGLLAFARGESDAARRDVGHALALPLAPLDAGARLLAECAAFAMAGDAAERADAERALFARADGPAPSAVPYALALAACALPQPSDARALVTSLARRLEERTVPPPAPASPAPGRTGA